MSLRRKMGALRWERLAWLAGIGYRRCFLFLAIVVLALVPAYFLYGTVETVDEPVLSYAGVAAKTDIGTPIPFYKLGDEAAPLLDEFEVVERTIPTAAPAALINSFGWVFAAGKHVVMHGAFYGDTVGQILVDNAYQAVQEPRAGDLVIYRDAEDAIVHCGVIKATGSEGFVLVESKWGFLGGCCLHEPAVYCEACQELGETRFEYYRSPRKGHVLKDIGYNQRARIAAGRTM